MANVVRVRVETKYNPSPEDRDSAFKRLMADFRKACQRSGILNTYKQHETFESKSRKKRRKKKESENARLKEKLRENFSQGKRNEPKS